MSEGEFEDRLRRLGRLSERTDAEALQRVTDHVLGNAPQQARIGRFEIEALLGTGGLGAVWRAWDPKLRRHVALKQLLERRKSPRLRRVIQAEAHALARLRHRHV